MKILPKNRSAVTLIELIVVISIIGILTVTMTPLFTDFRKNQDLIQAVETFKEDVKLTRTKAINGVVLDPGNANTKVWWGVKTCEDSDNKKYGLGYDNTGANVPSWYSPDKRIILSTNNSGIKFINGCTEFYFKRITGELYDTSGALNNKVITISDGSNSYDITIYKSGKIEVN